MLTWLQNTVYLNTWIGLFFVAQVLHAWYFVNGKTARDNQIVTVLHALSAAVLLVILMWSAGELQWKHVVTI
jgi:hypothetical protein